MAERQQALARVILKDPAVASLSSFIGIDGTNTTINSGRILINLKPVADRGISASDVIRRLQPQLAKVDGIDLFMQPVQDLTVEDRVSRTQFQYSLESPDPQELAVWVPRLMEKLKPLPELRDVASDQLDAGLGAQSGDRSRRRRAPWHLRPEPGRHPLRCIRPAPGLDDFYAAQPIPGGARSRPRFSEKSARL